MSTRTIKFSEGEYYHVYNRGTDKRTIFLDTKDYRRFLALLYVCNSTRAVDMTAHFQEGKSFMELFITERNDILVDIGPYCIMPNHFHILVREKVEGGLTKFMSKLATSYSMYFNKKNKRSGVLFEGKFKAKHANTDEYLKYLFAYIHLNPVKIIDPEWKKNGIADRDGAKKYLAEYTYSSYLDYMGTNRIEGKILNRDAFPEYFGEFKEFSQFIEEWLSFKELVE